MSFRLKDLTIKAKVEAAKQGGKRRFTAPPVDESKLEGMLASYFGSSAAPFSWGPYNLLTASKAAVGAGLLQAADFLKLYVEVSPGCYVPSPKQYQSMIVKLVKNGHLIRFPVPHHIWEGMGSMLDQNIEAWADKQVGKTTVLLAHVRRIAANPTKRSQCLR
eukprot:6455429-Amphidinium_carterae.1